MAVVCEDLAQYGVALVPPSSVEYFEVLADIERRLRTRPEGSPPIDDGVLSRISEHDTVVGTRAFAAVKTARVFAPAAPELKLSATMVFAIGQRILPAFCGARVLYSPRLMLASLAALNIGCALRVASEIPAYEANVRIAWHMLPCSAVIELLAVSLFAANLALTLLQPPAHLRSAVAIS